MVNQPLDRRANASGENKRYARGLITNTIVPSCLHVLLGYGLWASHRGFLCSALAQLSHDCVASMLSWAVFPVGRGCLGCVAMNGVRSY